MRRFALLLILSLLQLCFAATSSHAQGVATFAYQQGSLQLMRTHPPPLPSLPWQPEAAPQQFENAVITLNAEIRPSLSLYQQEGWINMGTLSGLNGMFFVFETPQSAYLKRMDYYQPLDALWLDETGMITSIAPMLSVAEIGEPLTDTKPSKAMLLLAGGTADRYQISPGDKIIESEFFAPPPKILTIQ